MNSKELERNPAWELEYEQEARSISIQQSHVAKIIAADTRQAEEVPTIPIDSMELVNTLQPEISVHAVSTTYLPNVPTPLVAQPFEYQRSPGAWIQIWRESLRPGYLPLSLMPLLLGTTLAWSQTVSAKMPLGVFHLRYLLVGLFCVLLIQFGGHLLNDYYDYIHGIDIGNMFGPGGLI